jgi:hypothetical protein
MDPSLKSFTIAQNGLEALGKKTSVRTFSNLETTIYDAVYQIQHTVSKADGRLVTSATKIKNMLVSEEEMRRFLHRLYKDQTGLCALTGLRMLLRNEDGPNDLLLSVDRINSNGHYEPMNIQLVCRFANFWKSSGDDHRFKQLIEMVRSIDR